MKFQKATKYDSRLRLALIGTAGSGKTFSALSIAMDLVPNGRVAVIDTERGSASKYADQFSFDVLELDRHSPTDYVAAIRAAEAEGYDVLVIDSLSHAWTGKGGALELVDQVAKRARTPNTFGAWREVTPLHNEMVDAIIGCKAHVIVTLRAKTDWVQEQDERGKTRIRKVGLAPVQRDGLEYEFDVVGDLDQDHSLLITKTRCSSLANAIVLRPGKELAGVLRGWLHGQDAPAPQQQERKQAQEPVPQAKQETPPAPEVPTIAKVLSMIESANTEIELLEAGHVAKNLPRQNQDEARSAYAKRLQVIRWREKVLSDLREKLGKKDQQLVDRLGARGVIIDADEDISKMSDESLDVVYETLYENDE